jgi:hypothetical protein
MKEQQSRPQSPPVVDGEDATPRSDSWSPRRMLIILLLACSLLWLLVGGLLWLVMNAAMRLLIQ